MNLDVTKKLQAGAKVKIGTVGNVAQTPENTRSRDPGKTVTTDPTDTVTVPPL